MTLNTTTFMAGTLLALTATFTDQTTTPPSAINPTTVSFTYVENGTGQAPTTYVYGATGSPITNPTTGTYTLNLDTTNLLGTYTYVWQSTGTGQAIAAGTFQITTSPIAS